MLDITSKPKNLDLEDWLKIFEEQNYLFVEGTGKSKEILQSGELIKCYDSLILAKAWLGKVLGELGENTPYVNDGKRKTVNDIEPTADKAGKATIIANSSSIATDENRGKSFESFSHIEKVDWLRQEIQHITHLVEQTIFTTNQSREFAIARTNTYNHLCEARFWLGFELQRIKEDGNSNN